MAAKVCYLAIKKSENAAVFNPLLPSVPYMWRSAKISILIYEGIIKKFYERRDYESVDEKRLS